MKCNYYINYIIMNRAYSYFIFVLCICGACRKQNGVSILWLSTFGDDCYPWGTICMDFMISNNNNQSIYLPYAKNDDFYFVIGLDTLPLFEEKDFHYQVEIEPNEELHYRLFHKVGKCDSATVYEMQKYELVYMPKRKDDLEYEWVPIEGIPVRRSNKYKFYFNGNLPEYERARRE